MWRSKFFRLSCFIERSRRRGCGWALPSGEGGEGGVWVQRADIICRAGRAWGPFSWVGVGLSGHRSVRLATLRGLLTAGDKARQGERHGMAWQHTCCLACVCHARSACLGSPTKVRRWLWCGVSLLLPARASGAPLVVADWNRTAHPILCVLVAWGPVGWPWATAALSALGPLAGGLWARQRGLAVHAIGVGAWCLAAWVEAVSEWPIIGLPGAKVCFGVPHASSGRVVVQGTCTAAAMRGPEAAAGTAGLPQACRCTVSASLSAGGSLLMA